MDLCRRRCIGHKIPAIENLGIAKVLTLSTSSLICKVQFKKIRF